ncbi:MAG: DUF3343 domain-containing protein [Eubacteriales bacterium]|nr:DUF3343 domain-containing protein [Eubacteriales bacterium]
MTQYLIMCPSLTAAQKTQMVFERAGISSAVVKAPRSLYANGCGYAVSLYRGIDRAKELLRKNGIMHGDIYKRKENGEYMLLD